MRHGRRAAASVALALVAVIGAARGTQDAVANGDTRTLKLHHTHTDETATITFKRDGRYDDAGLKQLNWLLRDWRRDEPTKMDPHLFDVVWEVYRETGAKAPIKVVSAYRSPATNAMLRSRGRGVAKFSQHMLGKAMDFYIPDASIDDIREAGLRLQRGGVGWYPTSGSPFVHLDTGNVRHWPRMSRQQLARVFPSGKTVHLPSDGRPLSGYELAAREIESRGGGVRSRTQLASRTEIEDDVDSGEDGKPIFRSRSRSDDAAPRRSLFAWLTGESDKPQAPAPSRAAPVEEKPVQVAVVSAPQAAPPPPAEPVPMPVPRPASAGGNAADGQAMRPAALVADAHQAIAKMPPITLQPTVAAAKGPATPTLRPSVEPAPAAAPAGPQMRWVTGPTGQPVASAEVASTPMPRPRPGREAAPTAPAPSGGGFALASASSTPVKMPTQAAAASDLPAVITQGSQAKPTDDNAMALAFAVPGDSAATRVQPQAKPAPVPAPVVTASVPPPVARAAAREAAPRLSAPRTEGAGLPRMITRARFADSAVDFRHPDQKAAASLLRRTQGALDMHFNREADELSSDRFAGPAIRPLAVARFESMVR